MVEMGSMVDEIIVINPIVAVGGGAVVISGKLAARHLTPGSTSIGQYKNPYRYRDRN